MSTKDQYFISKNTVNSDEVKISVPDPLTINDVYILDDLSVKDMVCTDSCLINGPFTATQGANLVTATIGNLTLPGNINVTGKSYLNEGQLNELLVDNSLWVGGPSDFFGTINGTKQMTINNTIVSNALKVNSTVEIGSGLSLLNGALIVKEGLGPYQTVISHAAVECRTLSADFLVITPSATVTQIGSLNEAVVFAPVESTMIGTGALRVTQGGASIQGNVFSNGLYAPRIVSSNSLAVTNQASVGSLQVANNSQLNTLTTSGSATVNSLTVNSMTSTAGLNVSNQLATQTLIVTGVTQAQSITGSTITAGSTLTGGELVVSNAIASTSTTSGALRCAGGIGAIGNIYAGGNIVSTGFNQASTFFAGSNGVRSSITNTTGMDFASGNIRMFISNTEIARFSSSGFRIGPNGTNATMLCYGRTLGQSAGVITVSFGTTFSSTPTVVCSAERNDTNYIFTYSLLSVSTTNFTYTWHWFSKAVPTGAYASADNHLINWVAIG